MYFGIFQAVMPILGYFLGSTFERFITNIDHWIAFSLLTGIGFDMLKEAFSKESEHSNDKVDFKTMIILSIATSIDALAVGITFACLKTKIIVPAITIGIITFFMSVIGVKIGNKFGDKYEKKAEIMGGVILILLGVKILLEHLGIINFWEQFGNGEKLSRPQKFAKNIEKLFYIVYNSKKIKENCLWKNL